MAFLCVCPEKTLEVGADDKLHRGEKEKFLRGVLESVNWGAGKKTVLMLPGGGIAVQYFDESPKIAVDSSNSTLAALTGHIQNYAYLVKKYLQQQLNLPANVTLEAVRERMPVSEVELLCKMYSQMGTGMISKIRGHFSFCIYDAMTVRVLAGRDCSGSVQLVQGKLCDNSLFVSSSDVYPGDAHDVYEIPPGHYKYGWHAGTVKFANAESEARQSAELASTAAQAALAGLFLKPLEGTNKSRRSSFDSAVLSQNHKAASRRGSIDVVKTGRRSMDSAASKSRADGQSWLKSETDIPSNTDTSKSKSSKKRSRKNRAKKVTQSGELSKPTSAEEFINKLGGAIREDPASVAMLMKLLEDSPCSLVVTDAKDNDKLVFVNKSFEDRTGYSFDEVIGKNCRFLQAPHGGSIVQSTGSRMLRKAIENGCSCTVRLINYKRDGSPVFNDCSIVPLRDPKGRITHHVGMHTFQSIAEEHATADSVQAVTSVLLRSRSCGDVASVMDVPSVQESQKDGVAF